MRSWSREFFFVVLLFSTTAFATRLGGGSITWTRDNSFVSFTDSRFEITVSIAGRPSAGGWSGPFVGRVYNLAIGVTPYNGAAVDYPIALTVQTIDTVEDTLYAEAKLMVTLPNTGLPAQILYGDCCRFVGLLDGNASRNFGLKATLEWAERSTTSTLPWTNVVALNQPMVLPIPAITPLGEALFANFAPLTDSFLGVQKPSGMTVSPSGVVRWTPTVVGTSAVQFKLAPMNSVGLVGNSIAQDVVFKVVDLAAIPVKVTLGPVCGQTFNVALGQELAFDVAATGVGTTQPISFTYSALPVGAGVDLVSSTNTAATTRFKWTPGRPVSPAPSASQYVCFQGKSGAITSVGPCCVFINVTSAPKERILTGTFRDFGSMHTDFARVDGDQFVQLVQPLIGSTRKPARSTATSTTVTSAASFATWFNDTTTGGQAAPTRALSVSLRTPRRRTQRCSTSGRRVSTRSNNS